MSPRSDFPARLKYFRELAGMSQRQFAAELCALTGTSSVTRTEVSRWENGGRHPEVWIDAIAVVLKMTVDELLGMNELPVCDPLALAWTVGRLDQRVDRRTLLHLAAVTAASATIGSALDPEDRLTKALTGRCRVDDATLAHLRDRTKGLHRLEEHYPAATLYGPLMTHLTEVSAVLENSSSDEARKLLAIAAGETAVLGAWFAWELGDAVRAGHLSKLAMLAAKHCEDAAAAACMTGYRTYMTRGNHRRGAELARDALDQLGKADATTRAWLLARLGEESALLGDHSSAAEAIREAEDVYFSGDHNRRPWMYFLDTGRFASMRLSVFSRIGDDPRAGNAFNDIVDHLGPGVETTKLCVVKADMALARLRLGDVTEAVTCARDALAATKAMASPLGWDRLDQVVAELAPSRKRTAAEFREEYVVSRPASSPSPL